MIPSTGRTRKPSEKKPSGPTMGGRLKVLWGGKIGTVWVSVACHEMTLRRASVATKPNLLDPVDGGCMWC